MTVEHRFLVAGREVLRELIESHGLSWVAECVGAHPDDLLQIANGGDTGKATARKLKEFLAGYDR